jgi:hypothetical protein
MPRNTTSAQDHLIAAAEQSDHIKNLISIIDDLDTQIGVLSLSAPLNHVKAVEPKERV